MKKTIITLVFVSFLFCFINVNANEIIKENDSLNPQSLIEGTWEWHNNNRIFRVTIFREDTGGFFGHFEMVEVNNGVETTVYKSDKPIFGYTGTRYLPAIEGGGSDEGFTGRILDNSIEYYPSDKQMVKAWLEMKIFTSGNLIKASWKVKFYDITPANKAPLNIPTDIVLTKVSL